MGPRAHAEITCPVCGRGTLRDIDFDGAEGGQQPSSREVRTFTCGHEVAGAALETADAQVLDVERRGSQETVDPPGA